MTNELDELKARVKHLEETTALQQKALRITLEALQGHQRIIEAMNPDVVLPSLQLPVTVH